MNKGIVLYQSKYGATRKYAAWIAEETGFDCMEIREAKIEKLLSYQTVIISGGIYASGIAGMAFLKKNSKRLTGKKIVVFCVGASPYDEKTFQELCRRNLQGCPEDTQCFYGRGSWNWKKMTKTDRILCDLLRKSIAKKDPDTYEPWQKALMEAGRNSCDWTDKAYLAPMLRYLKKE